MVKWFKKRQKGTDEFTPTESIFSELIKDKRRLTVIVLVQFIVIFYIIGGLKKPPIVIRLYGDGYVQTLKNYTQSNNLRAEDFPVFISSFIRNMNLSDSYHLKERTALAVSMMTKDLKDEYLNNILTEENLTAIKKLEWETETKIMKPTFKEKGDYILCKVTFVREITDNLNNLTHSQTYRGEIKLIAVKRSTEYPHGLSVQEYDYEHIKTDAH